MGFLSPPVSLNDWDGVECRHDGSEPCVDCQPAEGKAMDIGDIKKLLVLSKKEPVNCAIGLDKGGDAVILLHKIKAGMALLKDLEKEQGKLSQPAFGQAFVDMDEDPKLVILTLNRAPSGAGKKLKKTLAGTGFTKVEIRNEDGTVAEGEGSEAGLAAEAAPAAVPEPTPQPQDLEAALAVLIKQIPAVVAANASLAGELRQLAGSAVAAVRGADMALASAALAALQQALADAEAAPPPPPPPVDLKALQAELGGLIRQIPGIAASQPERLEPLKALAGEAAAAVKSADGATAVKAVQALREALAPVAARPARGPEPIVIWREAKEAVDERIAALRQSVLAHPDDVLKPTLAEIADKGLNGVTDRASVGMMVAMMEAGTVPAKARQAVASFRAFLGSDIARGIDENPFKVQVDLRRTLGAALDQIEARLAA
jgi:hypothetical protein